jgi:hypothetical protein
VLVVFIIAQGPKGEGMINSMNGTLPAPRARSAHVHQKRTRDASAHDCLGCAPACAESRMFGNFSETKNFVSIGTWGLVGAFLLLSALTALKH